VIDESKDVGVDTSEPDEIYEEAKSAFKNEDYKRCSELNKAAEEKALQLQDEHIQRVLALKEKRTELLEKKAEMEKAEEEATVQEEPAAAGEPEEREDLCPTCGAEMRYVEKYNRHWCRDCKKYGPKK
jgi:DNA repair exonuclease SbcCD ATPase subunit